MSSSQTPDIALVRRVIEVLRADANMQTLLFPSWADPRIDALDDRVYTTEVNLPEDSKHRSALPRILVEATWTPSQYEQDGPNLMGPVALFLHIVTPKEEEEAGGMLAAAVTQLLLSTQLSGPRIIAAGLYLSDQQRPKQRISAFTGAWEYMVQLRSAHVEVLL